MKLNFSPEFPENHSGHCPLPARWVEGAMFYITWQWLLCCVHSSLLKNVASCVSSGAGSVLSSAFQSDKTANMRKLLNNQVAKLLIHLLMEINIQGKRICSLHLNAFLI